MLDAETRESQQPRFWRIADQRVDETRFLPGDHLVATLRASEKSCGIRRREVGYPVASRSTKPLGRPPGAGAPLLDDHRGNRVGSLRIPVRESSGCAPQTARVCSTTLGRPPGQMRRWTPRARPVVFRDRAFGATRRLRLRSHDPENGSQRLRLSATTRRAARLAVTPHPRPANRSLRRVERETV